MAADPAFSVDVEERDLVVRLRRDLLDRDAVSRVLDYLELQAIRGRSRLSAADAGALVEEIDRAVWEQTRSLAAGEGGADRGGALAKGAGSLWRRR